MLGAEPLDCRFWSGSDVSGLQGLYIGSGGGRRRPSRLREPILERGFWGGAYKQDGRRSFYWFVGGFSGLTIVCRRDF